jgi:hypothetical protein
LDEWGRPSMKSIKVVSHASEGTGIGYKLPG